MKYHLMPILQVVGHGGPREETFPPDPEGFQAASYVLDWCAGGGLRAEECRAGPFGRAGAGL